MMQDADKRLVREDSSSFEDLKKDQLNLSSYQAWTNENTVEIEEQKVNILIPEESRVLIEDYIGVGGKREVKLAPISIDWFSLYSKKQFDFRDN